MAGSDAPWLVVPGFSLHDELLLLVKAGLTPADALRAATRDTVRFLGLQNSLGTIETGKLADLVLLDANPLQDIRNTQRITGVFTQGRSGSIGKLWIVSCRGSKPRRQRADLNFTPFPMRKDRCQIACSISSFGFCPRCGTAIRTAQNKDLAQFCSSAEMTDGIVEMQDKLITSIHNKARKRYEELLRARWSRDGHARKFIVEREELLPERTISCLTRSILLNWYGPFDTIP